MKLVESLYSAAPRPFQNAMVTAYGAYWHWLRFGRGYKGYVIDFIEREARSRQEWEGWTQERLSSVLQIAALEVPHYREHWSTGEMEAAACGELRGLPILEKDPIRRNPRGFLREGKGVGRRLVFHTSGSTGTPIASYWTVQEYRAAKALREARSARWAGVSFSMPRATFSGRLVEPNTESKGPYYRYNAVEKQVYFSAFHLKRETADSYVKALHRHGTQWLNGYAMSFYLLGQFIIELGLTPPPLKAIVTTSEKVTEGMRSTMQRAFGCPVFEEYSTVENAVFASECERGRLHVSPDAGIVEILRPDGTKCEPGEVGEVVATCLLRTHQPFIRFRLGDLAAWSRESCPCGRAMPILEEVVGRIEDVVVGPDGRKMVRFHGVFLGLPGVNCGQVRQERIDYIRVLVEAGEAYSPEVESVIRERVCERLGPEVKVSVERVERIPRGPGGKFRAVVSNVSN